VLQNLLAIAGEFHIGQPLDLVEEIIYLRRVSASRLQLFQYLLTSVKE